MKTLRIVACIGIGILAGTFNLHAAPYASGCTNTTGAMTGGVINYYLNETPAAGAVTITTYPSGNTMTPASPTQGLNSFTMPGNDTSYAISVSQTGSGAPSIESVASPNQANTNYGNPNPRGLAVNTSPTNGATFGTIYVSTAAGGGTQLRGIAGFNSDFSWAFGNTAAAYSTFWNSDTAGDGPFRLGVNTTDGSVWVCDYSGTFGGVWQLDPYLRASVTPTQIFDSTSADATHNAAYAVEATGSTANGNLVLYTYDFNLTSTAGNSTGGSAGGIGFGASQFNSYWGAVQANGPITQTGTTPCLFRFTIGSGPLPWSTAPDLAISVGLNASGGVTGSIEVSPSGNLFTACYRAAEGNGTAPYVAEYDPSGRTNLFCSAYNATSDIIYVNAINAGVPAGEGLAYSLKVSPDNKYLAVGSYYGWIGVYALTNGVVNPSAFTYIPFSVGHTRVYGIAWDAADNVYGLDNGTGALFPYDLGLTETCVTSNDWTGLNGSFSITFPTPSISVVATTPISSPGYGNPTNGVFTLQREGGTTADPLTVNYTLTGTATNGANYKTLPLSVTFPANVTNVTVTVTNNESSSVALPTLTAVLTIAPNPTVYSISGSGSDTVYVINQGPQTMVVSGTGAGSMYRAFPNDFVTFVVSRWGDTNAGAWTLPYSAFTPGGTAHYGGGTPDYTGGPQPVSYTTPASIGTSGGGITVNPGDTSEVVELGLPESHATFTGNQTITLSGTGGTSVEGTNYYFLASSTTAWLLDNLNPPEMILWADPLETVADEANWNVTFSTNGANVQYFYPDYNGVPGGGASATANFDIDFGYGPASGLQPSSPGYDYDYVPYPPNGSPNVMRMTVNKNSSITAQSAGVNIYPNNAPVFSGNYALRFDMNLVRGCADAYATEYVLFGINHYGTNVNWWLGSTDAGNFSFTNTDGIWFAINSDAGQSGNVGAYPSDFLEMTSINGSTIGVFPSSGYEPLNGYAYTSFTNVFKNPGNTVDANNVLMDYNANTMQLGSDDDAGVPANASGWASDNYSAGSCTPPGAEENVGPWTQVEVKQYNNVITMSLNKTVMFVYTNTTVFKSGYPMLGYMDPFTSYGTGGGAYFSNIRVVSLAGPTISSVTISNGNVVIQFTSPDADAEPSSFGVYTSSSTTTANHYTPVAATITESNGVFTAVTPYTGAAAEYFMVDQTNVSQ